MTKEEMIALLREGKVLEFNAYRREQRLYNDDKPGATYTGLDLSNAILSGVDLSGVDFSNTDLSGADLSHANLSRANLNQANITNANLKGANLFAVWFWGIRGPKTILNALLRQLEASWE